MRIAARHGTFAGGEDIKELAACMSVAPQFVQMRVRSEEFFVATVLIDHQRLTSELCKKLQGVITTAARFKLMQNDWGTIEILSGTVEPDIRIDGSAIFASEHLEGRFLAMDHRCCEEVLAQGKAEHARKLVSMANKFAPPAGARLVRNSPSKGNARTNVHERLKNCIF